MSTHKSTLCSYKHLNSWIRQKYIRLEASRVQNGGVSRDDYGNSKRWMKKALISRNKSSD